MPSTRSSTVPSPGGARDRLLEAAYELFASRGVQAVGVDAVIERSGVARQTMYRHFSSKQELVLAFLSLRNERWTEGWLQAEVMRRHDDARERLLSIFDLFDEWFHAPDFEGCSFVNVLLEYPEPSHPTHEAGARHLAQIRDFLAELAGDAGISDADAFASDWHILMKGSIVAAGEGDLNAARRARRMASTVLEHALP